MQGMNMQTPTRQMRQLRRTHKRPIRASLLGSVLVAALFLGGCDVVKGFFQGNDVKAAQNRLQFVLDEVVKGTHLVNQEVICVFYKSSRKGCSMDELESGLSSFEKWLREKRINKGIQSYSVVEGWEVPNAPRETYYFHVEINGKNAYILVPERATFSWTKKTDKP